MKFNPTQFISACIVGASIVAMYLWKDPILAIYLMLGAIWFQDKPS